MTENNTENNAEQFSIETKFLYTYFKRRYNIKGLDLVQETGHYDNWYRLTFKLADESIFIRIGALAKIEDIEQAFIDVYKRQCGNIRDIQQEGFIEPAKTEGKKFDTGKPRLAEMIKDFREPLIEVAKIWEFGANKYDKGNWRFVDNGLDRYSNALLRHLVAEEDAQLDDESNLYHAAHVAWNALARLHFILQQAKNTEDSVNGL